MPAQVFLRLLAVTYLIAFWSLATQILGLAGSQGVLSAGDFLKGAAQYYGPSHFWQIPTLCWLNHSDGFLLFLCYAGMACSTLLFFGVVPCVSAAVLWALYLSLAGVGQDFLGFQWDNLLLEAGFLAIFLFPLRLSRPPSKAIIWLLRWLLFRLMFESGVVKLLSGDFNWANLTALTYHYLTQPLPNVISWYFYQLPVWFHKLSCAVVLVVEVLVPFLIFCGRRARRVAFYVFIVFQALIILTGNYCFFNLLTIALCFTLFDGPDVKPSRAHQWVAGIVAAAIVLISLSQVAAMYRPFPTLMRKMVQAVEPFRTVNVYGLFAVMTTQRNEIIIEGSRDGVTWLPYEFRWKPGDPAQAPRWAMPHQPRLDWQMWFAALGNYRENPWLMNLMGRLLQGSKPVIALLEKDPFPGSPPRYIRAAFYEYRFTDTLTRRKIHHWWQREYKAPYSPEMSLSQ